MREITAEQFALHEQASKKPKATQSVSRTNDPELPRDRALPLEDDIFWALIGTHIDPLAESHIVEIRARLVGLPDHAIRQFEETLARKLYDLDWPIAKSSKDGVAGLIGDAHLYVRCGAVLQGAGYYNQRISDHLLEDRDPDAAESVLYLASDVLSERSGRIAPLRTSVSYETGSNSAHWSDEVEERLAVDRVVPKVTSTDRLPRLFWSWFSVRWADFDGTTARNIFIVVSAPDSHHAFERSRALAQRNSGNKERRLVMASDPVELRHIFFSNGMRIWPDEV